MSQSAHGILGLFLFPFLFASFLTLLYPGGSNCGGAFFVIGYPARLCTSNHSKFDCTKIISRDKQMCRQGPPAQPTSHPHCRRRT
ncbi:hypothetical protein L873DRAFT_1093886 [Choiromyces venosus 120613-1]|uniref:Secreted protein n=1 Tax=Choiromyces venosus 120613-1 TaxID=1336337 RepID=A0A3N4JN56_9PEZI|nr:hypothetical protein L873DRAFT_1093886 [Choiromyces venosus 120613-1]